MPLLNHKQKTIGFLFFVMIGVLVVVFINSDHLFNNLDEAITPYVKYDKDEHCNATSSGTADAQAITRIHIHWEDGDVLVKYSSQNRISWIEKFVKGEPTQYNTQYYWMNSHTLYIEFLNQDYFSMDKKSRQEISKDLTLLIPEGVLLDELVIHNAHGKVTSEVQSKIEDIHVGN